MKQDSLQLTVLREIIERIHQFDEITEEEQYTCTEAAWDLFDDIRWIAQGAIDPTRALDEMLEPRSVVAPLLGQEE